MQVRQLSAYDVAPQTLDALCAAVGESLLPVQALAVREGLLGSAEEGGRGQSLLIAAPTSSGKSFVGELAAVHAAARGQRVFYLVPLKAMAEEVYRALVGRYQGLGLKVAISSRDHRSFDDAIESGDCHVAVMVFEKLQSLLVSRPELLDKVGLLVLDELQMLMDQGRGPRLELLLTKVRRASRAGQGVQIVGLSAPMAGLDELGAWLGAKVVLDERRPVELRAGVLHRGQFTYCSSRSSSFVPVPYESPRLTEELYPDAGAEDEEARLCHLVRALSRRGEQTLVFLPDRARSLATAELLGEALAGEPVDADAAAARQQMLEEISATDEGQARAALTKTLLRGVAFHNADLTQAQREVVERHFRKGHVRVLCATSTLAMGVNLPAKNVIIAERWKWRYSRRYAKWIRDDLTKLEYDGMAGRAGRLGLCDPVQNFGRAMLLAPSRFDAEVWLRTLVDAPAAELGPALLGKPLGDVILDIVASSLARTEEEVGDFVLSTFTGTVRWARQPGPGALRDALAVTVEDLVRADLLAREEDTGHLAVTASGRVCARKGLMVRTAVLLGRWADAAAAPEVRFTALEVLLVCALTPDGGEAHVPLSLPEHRFGDYWTRILLRAQELGAADRRLFRWLREQRGRLTYEQTKAVKKALLLLDWVDHQDGAQIERDHSVWSGAVAGAAADFAWLAEALAELCDARGWPSERSAELYRLGERLRYGVAEDLLGLARATSKVLSRSQLRRVAEAGLRDEAALLQAEPAVLEKAVGHRRILHSIMQIQAARRAMRPPAEPAAPVEVPAAAPPSLAVVLPLRPLAATPLAAAVPAPAPAPAPASAPSPEPAEPVVSADLLAAATAGLSRMSQLPLLRPVLVRPAGAAPMVEEEAAPQAGVSVPVTPAVARAVVAAAAAAEPLVLTPEVGPRRCYVRRGDRRAALSPVSFALLCQLVVLGEQRQGWVAGELLGRSASGVRKGVSRLRRELRQVSSEARSWIENDGQGHYRLSLVAPPVVVDRQALREHPLPAVRAIIVAA